MTVLIFTIYSPPFRTAGLNLGSLRSLPRSCWTYAQGNMQGRWLFISPIQEEWAHRGSVLNRRVKKSPSSKGKYEMSFMMPAKK